MTDLQKIELAANANLDVAAQAMRFVVEDDDSAVTAGQMIGDVLAAVKQIEAARLEITRPLDAAKSAAMEQAKAAQAPYRAAEKHLRDQLREWKIQAELRKEDALAQLERRDAELEAAAMRAAEEGRYDDAQAAQEERLVPFEDVPTRVKNPPNVSFRTTWSAEVFDLPSLLAAILRGDVPLEAVKPNQAFLDAEARRAKGPSMYPGVRFTSEVTVAAGAR